MKSAVRFCLMLAGLLVVAGCATSGDNSFRPKLPPPDVMNPVYMEYTQMPPNKVFVVAVDPDGTWAFGFDYGRETIEEAARNAAVKCDKARERHGVHTKGSLFAVNDEIVYYKR